MTDTALKTKPDAKPKPFKVSDPHTRARNKAMLWEEFWEGAFNWRYWVTLAWTDIRGRYRRTLLGPFWTTINSVVFVVIISSVYSLLWQVSLKEFLPFVAAGYFIWVYFAGCLTESCGVFMASGEIIKTVPISPMSLIMRVVVRNIFVLLHNIVVFVPIALIFNVSLKYIALALPGTVLVSLFLAGCAMIVSFLCARFRDFEQVMASLLMLLFFITPILWDEKILPQKASFLSEYNLVFHLIEVIRAPMLGELPSALSLGVSLICTVVALTVGLVVYIKNRHKLAYWL